MKIYKRSKKCSCCKQTKHQEEFSWKVKSKRLRNTKCRECVNNYNRQHYKDNKDYYLRKTKQSYNKLATLLYSFKFSNSCNVCGENTPSCLEFNHINRKDKEYQISNMCKMGVSQEQFIKEVQKCEILCCNCHRKRTAKQLGWLTSKYDHLFLNKKTLA